MAILLYMESGLKMVALLNKIFGSSNERYLKSLNPVIDEVNSLESEYEKLSDEQLRAKTAEFKSRIEKGESLDDILPEAFAVVREGAKRTLKQRHYDVQLIGGMVLHQGKISEMRTGEGKTLVSTLPAYLNALTGKGVHIVTVNDYLAKRDSDWMGQVYKFLGLSVGVILHGQSHMEKQEQYKCDITYGTNHEFGFDYLRDNMKFSLDEMVQRPFSYAIIDEVDSILIDEARTPLIISGPVEDRTDLYVKINKIIPKLTPQDYEKDEKSNNVLLTDNGTHNLEELLRAEGIITSTSGLYDLENIKVLHHANQALRAHTLFSRDKDYLVKDGKVFIIDEFTGRIMDGRRYSDGLHQALEAKENVKIESENQTLASITYQNYFRLYPKLAGMTGTAMTEATEFDEIYKLSVVDIPTNVPVKRIDEDDNIYRAETEKFDAITEVIIEANKKGQPVLAGTASVEKSELLSKHLKKAGIKHNILNAKQHDREALTIAQAGRPGTVTVATNMAGRGTDIQLGGNPELLIRERIGDNTDAEFITRVTAEVKAQIEQDRKTVLEAGGLCVLGTERHESRRIDNQLRGRSGRQGDPGFSKFFLSAEDDLIRIFGADKKMDWILGKMGTPGEAINHPMLTRVMEKAQAKVEARNFDIRKNLLKFDDVMNEQRKAIYAQRMEIMKAEDVRIKINEMLEQQVDDLVSLYIPHNSYPEQWQSETLEHEVFRIFGVHIPINDWAKEEGVADQEIFERTLTLLDAEHKRRDESFGSQQMKLMEKRILLYTLDEVWKEHLHFLDNLRHGINLRAYAQKDPLNEYKKEAFDAFGSMVKFLNEKYLDRLFHIQIHVDEDVDKILALRQQKNIHETNVDPAVGGSGMQFNPGLRKDPKVTIRTHIKAEDRNPMDPSTWGKVGRNDACPCNSGKKFKQCHGAVV